jgi:aspartyl protease family protein
MFPLRALFLVIAAPTLLFAQEKSPGADPLKSLGCKLAGDVVVLNEESDVDKSFRALKANYNTVIAAKKTLNQVEQLSQQNRDAIKQLQQERTNISSALATANLTTREHNALVTRYNSLGDMISNRIEIDQKGEELAKARSAYSTPRNQFMKSVVDLKSLIETTNSKYDSLKDDAGLRKTMEELGESKKKTLTLGPSKSYQQTIKEFSRYEALVMLEDIPLEGRGGTYRLDVMLNGNVPIKMILDTGASSISLSYDNARRVGINLTDKDPDVLVSIANGRTVKAKRAKLASVRVGKFEVKNVDCVVMPEDYSDSPSLLGGSFLNNFKYEVDADGKKLRLSKIDGANTGGKTK